MRSATCGPSIATMRKICPARTGQARPERRGMTKRSTELPRAGVLRQATVELVVHFERRPGFRLVDHVWLRHGLSLLHASRARVRGFDSERRRHRLTRVSSPPKARSERAGPGAKRFGQGPPADQRTTPMRRQRVLNSIASTRRRPLRVCVNGLRPPSPPRPAPANRRIRRVDSRSGPPRARVVPAPCPAATRGRMPTFFTSIEEIDHAIRAALRGAAAVHGHQRRLERALQGNTGAVRGSPRKPASTTSGSWSITSSRGSRARPVRKSCSGR